MSQPRGTSLAGFVGVLLRPDASALSLLASNLITIGLALWQRWDLAPLMWVYWCQSCIIGVFNFIRILNLGEFSTEGFKINDRSVEPTRETKIKTAFFFLIHYGFFHLGYLVFLLVDRRLHPENTVPVLICVGIFYVNHLFSFRHNLEGDRRQKRNIGALMMFPYARILPMHLSIVTGAAMKVATGGLVIFLGLKTLADLIMHAVEHRQKSDPAVASDDRPPLLGGSPDEPRP